MARYADAKTRHANTARVMWAGEIVAECVGVTLRESGGTNPIHVTGTPYPTEHLHDKYSGQLTIDVLIWKDSAMKQWCVGGKELINLPTFDLVATDEVENGEATLWTAVDCTLADRSAQVQANTRMSSNITAYCLKTLEADDVGDGAGGGAVAGGGLGQT